MNEPTKTQIDVGLIKRISQGFSYAFKKDTSWMSPGKILNPVITEAQQIYGVKGRRFDMQVGINSRTQIGSEDNSRALSYEQLRSLANYDLVRMAIRTRTDQVSRLRFSVNYRDKNKKQDEKCLEVEKILRRPEFAGTKSFQSWLREIVEQLLIVDTIVVMPRKSLADKIIGFDLIDGSLIKKVIDESGRTPEPPNTAYQQILKGVPAANFTVDEILVLHRNTSTDRIYGRSPVEEIAMTINVGLRRQLNQLSYFTDSNMPSGFLSTPSEWTPDQIQEYSTYIDQMLAGNLQQRSKILLTPGGVNFQEAKEAPLKGEFDEWLARNICYAFSLSPQAFVRDNNRSTSEEASKQAKEEGLGPLQEWIKNDLMDVLIEKFFGYDDIEFVWSEEKSIDPLIQSSINVSYVQNGILTINEVRESIGKEALKENIQEKNDIIEDNTNYKLYKHVCSLKCNHSIDDGLFKSLKKKVLIDRNREIIVKSEKEFSRILKKSFKSLKSDLIKLFQEKTLNKRDDFDDEEDEEDEENYYSMTNKDAVDRSNKILESLSLSYAALISSLSKTYSKVSYDSVTNVIEQLKQYNVDINSDQEMIIRERAIKEATDRGADLIGMKYDSKAGWIPNPNSEMSITDSTRLMIRDDLISALENGLSSEAFSDVLNQSYGFSNSRAEKIARTEIAWADVQGNLTAYRESNQVSGKKWIAEADACDICQKNESAGIILLDEAFPDGSDGPPGHPNCKCDVIPVIKEEKNE